MLSLIKKIFYTIIWVLLAPTFFIGVKYLLDDSKIINLKTFQWYFMLLGYTSVFCFAVWLLKNAWNPLESEKETDGREIYIFICFSVEIFAICYAINDFLN